VSPLLFLAAACGVVAVGTRLLGSALRLGVAAFRESATRSLAEVSARTGDLTALEERAAQSAALRSDRRRRGALVAFWGALLLAPLALGPTPQLYAAYNLLWLLPRRSRKEALRA
jgi:hypothetical protein